MTLKPTFNTQITLGNIIQIVLILVAGCGIYFTAKAEIENNTRARVVIEARIERLEADTTSRINNVLAEINRKLEAQEVNNRAQDVTLGRQDERLTLILQGLARLEAAIERDRRDGR